MSRYVFRILDAYAEGPLGGNPPAVFEDAGELDGATMTDRSVSAVR